MKYQEARIVFVGDGTYTVLLFMCIGSLVGVECGVLAAEIEV